jgi:hypothetical protein
VPARETVDDGFCLTPPKGAPAGALGVNGLAGTLVFGLPAMNEDRRASTRSNALEGVGLSGSGRGNKDADEAADGVKLFTDLGSNGDVFMPFTLA